LCWEPTRKEHFLPLISMDTMGRLPPVLNITDGRGEYTGVGKWFGSHSQTVKKKRTDRKGVQENVCGRKLPQE